MPMLAAQDEEIQQVRRSPVHAYFSVERRRGRCFPSQGSVEVLERLLPLLLEVVHGNEELAPGNHGKTVDRVTPIDQ